jgi:hypothetical protein
MLDNAVKPHGIHLHGLTIFFSPVYLDVSETGPVAG